MKNIQQEFSEAIENSKGFEDTSSYGMIWKINEPKAILEISSIHIRNQIDLLSKISAIVPFGCHTAHTYIQDKINTAENELKQIKAGGV